MNSQVIPMVGVLCNCSISSKIDIFAKQILSYTLPDGANSWHSDEQLWVV